VVVSGAAGATGSVVCQLAKLSGCNVVGIAGSEEKCTWLSSIGCDSTLNYKDPEFAKNFKKATPNYVDILFDNTGGEILDLALNRLAFKGISYSRLLYQDASLFVVEYRNTTLQQRSRGRLRI
jgi:NADPH-dependent curcumin reductase CurA